MRNRLNIRLLVLGVLILTFFLPQNSLWTGKREDPEFTPLKFSLTGKESLTFGGLQNSTYYEVVGANPSEFPGEFYNIQVNVSIFCVPIWFNTTRSLFHITNHDTNDVDLVFKASGGSRVFQWIIMEFSQIEEEITTFSSIIWNDTGNIIFQGRWKFREVAIQENKGTLSLPGTKNEIQHSIEFSSMSILFDENITKSDIQNLRCSLEIVPIFVEGEKKSSGFSLFSSIISLIVFFSFLRPKLIKKKKKYS